MKFNTWYENLNTVNVELYLWNHENRIVNDLLGYQKKNISGIQYESKESTIIKKIYIFELPDPIVWSSGQQLCTNFWNVCTMKDLDKHYKASHPSNPLTG